MTDKTTTKKELEAQHCKLLDAIEKLNAESDALGRKIAGIKEEPEEFDWCEKPPMLLVKDASCDSWNQRILCKRAKNKGIVAGGREWELYKLGDGIVYEHNGNGQLPCAPDRMVIRKIGDVVVTRLCTDQVDWNDAYKFYLEPEGF